MGENRFGGNLIFAVKQSRRPEYLPLNAIELADFWDRAIQDFLQGGPAVPPELGDWFDSYTGTGDGAPQLDAMPEPWLGRLASQPRAVFLQLNPGKVDSRQQRGGLFARQMREMGGYSAWAAKPPYWCDGEAKDDPALSGSPESARFWKYSKQFSRVRLKFTQRWFNDPAIDYDDILMFELYPWHSARLTEHLRPPLHFVDDFIWKPIADTGSRIVFAFGSPWFGLLPKLGIEWVDELDAHHFRVLSRSVLIGRMHDADVWVVAEKHSGSAGPPAADDMSRVREYFEKLQRRG